MANPPAFALTPAIVVEGIIDFRLEEGRKIYSSAIAKLDDELYDCKPEGLYQFLQSLNNRAQDFGWNDEIGILMIPEDPEDEDSPTEYLIENYGLMSIDRIRRFEETYLGQESRAAQDNYMLFKCLMNSISKEGKNKVVIWREQYTVNGITSGNLLLKIIIRESHLDTNATTTSIRTKLSGLDVYLPSIGSDITKFNVYVKLLIDSLTARGETTQDLLINLFKGYQSASDKAFVEYIGRKLERYEEGEDLSPEQLMEYADNKYKQLKVTGRWNAPSAEEEKILALQAQIKNLKKTGSKIQKENNKKGKKVKFSRKGSQKPNWFNKEPKPEEITKPREWNGYNWYWCGPKSGGKCHGIYRRHKPSECKGKEYLKNNPTKRKTEDNKNHEEKVMKISKALQATVRLSGSDTDNSEE